MTAAGHVRHAAVAHLQRVFIEDLVGPAVLREMLADKREKLHVNVGGNILTKRWVEPSDVAKPILPYHILAVDLPALKKLNLLTKSTLPSRIVVQLPRILESRGIAGNVGQAAADSRGVFFNMLGGWLDCR